MIKSLTILLYENIRVVLNLGVFCDFWRYYFHFLFLLTKLRNILLLLISCAIVFDENDVLFRVGSQSLSFFKLLCQSLFTEGFRKSAISKVVFWSFVFDVIRKVLKLHRLLILINLALIQCAAIDAFIRAYIALETLLHLCVGDLLYRIINNLRRALEVNLLSLPKLFQFELCQYVIILLPSFLLGDLFWKIPLLLLPLVVKGNKCAVLLFLLVW